jgi:hypothetical protein
VVRDSSRLGRTVAPVVSATGVFRVTAFRVIMDRTPGGSGDSPRASYFVVPMEEVW